MIASYRPSLFVIYDIAGHILQSILVIDQTFNVLIGMCQRVKKNRRDNGNEVLVAIRIVL